MGNIIDMAEWLDGGYELPYFSVPSEVIDHGRDHEMVSDSVDAFPSGSTVVLVVDGLSASLNTGNARLLAYQLLEWSEAIEAND
jgi:hypothetical protein